MSTSRLPVLGALSVSGLVGSGFLGITIVSFISAYLLVRFINRKSSKTV